MKGELQKIDAQPVAHPMPAQSFDIESVFRYALEKGAGPESMTTLMNVRRELKAEASKQAFDLAMAALQAELPIIQKRKSGAKNAYKYAPLDDIVAQVQPLLLKHGFSFTVTSEVEKDWVKAICKITHRDGHSDHSEFKCPVDARNTMMNDPQRYAGSLTFCKRYAFCNAFGILTGDEDVDGGVRQKPAGPSSLAGDRAQSKNDTENKRALVDLLRHEHGIKEGYALDDAAKDMITQYLVDEAIISDTETIADLTGEKLAKAVEAVKKKIGK